MAVTKPGEAPSQFISGRATYSTAMWRVHLYNAIRARVLLTSLLQISYLIQNRGQLSNHKMTIMIHQAGRCSLLLVLVSTLIHGLDALQPWIWLVIHGGSPARA